MITTSALLAFFGFFAGYNSSRKAVLAGDSRLELWLRNNPSNAKISGLLLLLAAFILMAMNKGIGAGSFIFLVMLMVFGSLVILLSPLKIVTLKTATIAFAIAFSVEFLNLV